MQQPGAQREILCFIVYVFIRRLPVTGSNTEEVLFLTRGCTMGPDLFWLLSSNICWGCILASLMLMWGAERFNVCEWIIKGIVHPKIKIKSHHVLSLMSFPTCRTLFLLWNSKDILKGMKASVTIHFHCDLDDFLIISSTTYLCNIHYSSKRWGK